MRNCLRIHWSTAASSPSSARLPGANIELGRSPHSAPGPPGSAVSKTLSVQHEVPEASLASCLGPGPSRTRFSHPKTAKMFSRVAGFAGPVPPAGHRACLACTPHFLCPYLHSSPEAPGRAVGASKRAGSHLGTWGSCSQALSLRMWGGRDRQGRGTGSAPHLWPAEERTLASLPLCAKLYLELK